MFLFSSPRMQSSALFSQDPTERDNSNELLSQVHDHAQPYELSSTINAFDSEYDNRYDGDDSKYDQTLNMTRILWRIYLTVPSIMFK